MTRLTALNNTQRPAQDMRRSSSHIANRPIRSAYGLAHFGSARYRFQETGMARGDLTDQEWVLIVPILPPERRY